MMIGLLLGGCGSVNIRRGDEGYLVTGTAPSGKPYVPTVMMTGCFPTDTIKCTPIVVTENPSDEEFWQFEARVKVRALIGIPYGRMPQDFAIAGTQQQCEEFRQGVGREGTPTEPCVGPHYFKRLDPPDAPPGRP